MVFLLEFLSKPVFLFSVLLSHVLIPAPSLLPPLTISSTKVRRSLGSLLSHYPPPHPVLRTIAGKEQTPSVLWDDSTSGNRKMLGPGLAHAQRFGPLNCLQACQSLSPDLEERGRRPVTSQNCDAPGSPAPSRRWLGIQLSAP